MLPVVIFALQILSVPAQNTVNVPGLDIGSIATPDLTGCDASVTTCFSGITALITPEGCGLPPLNGNANADLIKWTQCACPKLVPIYECLDASAAKCPALNAFASQVTPLIKNGCSGATGSNSTTNVTTTTGTNSSATPSAKSEGLTVTASIVSFLVMGLIF